MILYYILILLIPFQSHAYLSKALFGSTDFTPIKVIGTITVLYSIFYYLFKKYNSNSISLFNRVSLAFLLFSLICIISSILNYTPETKQALTTIISFVIFFVPTVLLVDEEKKLRKVFLAIILSMLLSARSVYKEWFVFSQIYSNFRPWSSFGDPNYYSLSAIIAISFLLSFIEQEQRKNVKLFFIFIFIVMLGSFLLAASRGGLLGLTFVIFYYFIRFNKKVKTMVIFGLLLLIMFNFVPDHLKERLMVFIPIGQTQAQELTHYQQATLASSARRIELARAGMYMLLDKPLFGVGYGKFRQESTKYNPVLNEIGGPGIAHCIYIDVLAETGLISFLFFALIIVFTFQNLHSIPLSESRIMYKRGIKGALLGFLTAAFFLSALNTKFFWLVIFLTISMGNIFRSERDKEESGNS